MFQVKNSLNSLIAYRDKYYDKMTRDQKKTFDAIVVKNMKRIEETNQRLHEIEQDLPLEKDFDLPLDKILTQTSVYRGEEIEDSSKKESVSEEEEVEAKAPSLKETAQAALEVSREKVKNFVAMLKSEPKKEPEEKMLEKIENCFLACTKDERKMLAKEVQKRFGQSFTSKLVTTLTHKGYKFVKYFKKPDEAIDSTIELCFELNDARNAAVKETKKIIMEPTSSIRKYGEKLKEWLGN